MNLGVLEQWKGGTLQLLKCWKDFVLELLRLNDTVKKNIRLENRTLNWCTLALFTEFHSYQGDSKCGLSDLKIKSLPEKKMKKERNSE